MDTVAQIEAQMLAKARAVVLDSGSYLAAADMPCCSSAQLEKWKRDHLTFAFDHDGADLFPAYALDPKNGWTPYPALARILAIFDGKKSPWGCAFWFEGVNGFLDGKAPKDVLATDPDRVIQAAAREIEPVAHA